MLGRVAKFALVVLVDYKYFTEKNIIKYFTSKQMEH